MGEFVSGILRYGMCNSVSFHFFMSRFGVFVNQQTLDSSGEVILNIPEEFEPELVSHFPCTSKAPRSVTSSDPGTQFERGTASTSASGVEMAVASSYSTYCEVVDLDDDDLDLQQALLQSTCIEAVTVEERSHMPTFQLVYLCEASSIYDSPRINAGCFCNISPKGLQIVKSVIEESVIQIR